MVLRWPDVQLIFLSNCVTEPLQKLHVMFSWKGNLYMGIHKTLSGNYTFLPWMWSTFLQLCLAVVLISNHIYRHQNYTENPVWGGGHVLSGEGACCHTREGRRMTCRSWPSPSFHHVVPGTELKSPGSAASGLTHWTTSRAPFWNLSFFFNF